MNSSQHAFNIKRIVAIILSLAMIFALCSCNTVAPESSEVSSTDSNNQSSAPTSEKEEQESENVNSDNPSSSEATSSAENSISEPIHTHSYTSAKVSPTCTADGYTKHTCTCGSTYTDSVKSALGHNWGDWITTKEPTTTVAGTKKRTCSRCPVSETATIAKLEEPALSESEFIELAIKYSLEYLNEARVAQGDTELVPLTGKAKQYARLRSEQLITNFAHDLDDKWAAATQLQYGEHIVEPEKKWDPVKQETYYTGKTLDYYKGSGAEAIELFTDTVGTTENGAKSLAKYIVDLCKNSNSHWSYIGDSLYSYGTVGITFKRGFCYVCILVDTNCEYD